MKRFSKEKAKRKSTRSIEIIAEDESDIAVVKTLIGKIATVPFSVKSTAAGGCGKIAGKCRIWAQNLQERGCRYLLIIHDLDTRILNTLRTELTAALKPCPIGSHLIVIPVREIEAWLLADHVAVTRAMKLQRALNEVANPEAILRPKERLADLVYTRSGTKRRYLNTVDNAKIAEHCIINNLKRCASFVPLRISLVRT